MRLADSDLPSVVVLTAEFAALGQRLATILERAALPRLILPYPLEGLPEAEVRAHGHHAYPELVGLLGATS